MIQKLTTLWKYIKKIYILLPMLVLLYHIYVPFVRNLFYSNTALLDNRALYAKPKTFSRTFAKEFTDYYNDTIAERKKLINKYVDLKKMLKIDTGHFFYGQDDWMFYDSVKVGNGNSMLGYIGEFRLPQKDLDHLVYLLEKERDFYTSRGASFTLMVVPDKENVYSEYLPDNWQGARVSDVAFSDVALTYVADNSKTDVLRMKPLLLDAKQIFPHRIYYKQDTHWNSLGAYVGFYHMMQKLGKYGVPAKIAPSPDKIKIVKEEVVSQDMNPQGRDINYQLDYHLEKSFKKIESKPEDFITVFENENPLVKGTLLFVGDSFSYAMAPYLAKTFERVVCIGFKSRHPGFYSEMMDKYRPRWVVHELVERFFIGLPSGDKYVNEL